MIKTTEEIENEQSLEFIRMMKILGGNVIFDKPIRFRLTPHSPTKKIYSLSITEDFNDFGDVKDTILQVLRGLTHKHKNDENN